MSLSRREVLRLGGLAACAAVAACASPRPAAPGDLDLIVAAYRELQIGTNRPSPARAKALAALDEPAGRFDAAMNLTGGALWPDLPFRLDTSTVGHLYYRLRTVAVAWPTPGSAMSARAELPQRISVALELLYRNQYHEQLPERGNWYLYEIGVPYLLLQILVTLGDRVAAPDRERYLRPVLRFVADPNRRTSTGAVETGANRADKALIAVVSGALAGDAARVAAGIAAVTDTAGNGQASVIRPVTVGDGFHPDGSFLQHDRVPYSGHYGLVLLKAMAALLRVTSAVQDPALRLTPRVRDQIIHTVADVFEPFVADGAVMEPIRGRMLSRQDETGRDAGQQLVSSVALLAKSGTEPDRTQLAGLAARWIADGADAADPRIAGGVPEVEHAEALLGDATVPATPPPPIHRVFSQMDRMVHRTARWSASLGLSSTRITRYEAINGQNKHGWFTGDGVLYLFLPTQRTHYSDAYWPTVDATLLPSTTEKASPPPPLLTDRPTTPNAFAGGVRFNAGHGAHGLDFTSQDGTLTAKKAWFFTSDAVLCLGAGITDRSGAPIRTTVENRNLGENATTRLLIDGELGPTLPGPTITRVSPRWFHLDGIAGYVLLDPTPTSVTVLREDRTGSWSDIDTGEDTRGTAVRYTRRYQQLRLEHGVNPADATYAWAVLPGAGADDTWTTPGLMEALGSGKDHGHGNGDKTPGGTEAARGGDGARAGTRVGIKPWGDRPGGHPAGVEPRDVAGLGPPGRQGASAFG